MTIKLDPAVKKNYKKKLQDYGVTLRLLIEDHCRAVTELDDLSFRLYLVDVMQRTIERNGKIRRMTKNSLVRTGEIVEPVEVDSI